MISLQYSREKQYIPHTIHLYYIIVDVLYQHELTIQIRPRKRLPGIQKWPGQSAFFSKMPLYFMVFWNTIVTSYVTVVALYGTVVAKS